MSDVPVIRLPAALSGVELCQAPGEGRQDPADEARAMLDKQTAQLRQACQALRSGLQQLQKLKGELVQTAEEQLVDLALQIVRKVLMQEIQAGRYEIGPIVAEALRRVPEHQAAVVRMNPEDLAQCPMAAPQADQAEQGNVKFVADPTIRRAQCVVETPDGLVELDVESHLQQIAEALHGEDS